MKKVLILIAHNHDDAFYLEQMKALASRYKFKLIVSDSHEDITLRPNFVFCFSYRKLIPAEWIDRAKGKIYVFHSSDLPRGKGWAPIYHSIVSRRPTHVLTMLTIDPTVDGGDLIAKAYFPKRPGEDADSLRQVDNVMTFKIIEQVLPDLLRGHLIGTKQTGRSSYHPRRRPEDNRVRANQTLAAILPHCLAVTAAHPAFVIHQGVKYLVTIRAAKFPPLETQKISVKKFYDVDTAQ